MRQNNGADSLNNQVDIIKKKQQAVNELIDKIALSFKTSGITKRHVDKAKKYYLNLKEVKSPACNIKSTSLKASNTFSGICLALSGI